MMNLNEAQRSAVEAEDGPSLILAGAGSGKTRVIVERVVWLIEERGVDPRNILALTFTNRAANEMRERIIARLGVERLASWVGTFHGFGLFFLRREIDRLERSKTFTIMDDADQVSLMKRLIKDLPAHFDRVTPREALEWVSALKQKLETPDFDGPVQSPQHITFKELWLRYHTALMNASALDFDDLLSLTANVLAKNEDVREKYGRRYRHVMIDEYQDTNHAQYEIARLLTESHRNIFAVGDEDQSIYSWRGADINNILEFEKTFPGARVFRLEQNYRSAAPILKAANAVVKNNEDRLGKTLWTAQTEGAPVRFCFAKDAEDEARFIVEDFAASGMAPSESAILYRTNNQARVLEDALRGKGIAYIVVGGVKFYSRKEIKDILCYLRLLVNPSDDESVRRVANVPARGVGATTMQRVEDLAVERGIHLLELMREIEHDGSFQTRARESMSAFVHLIDELTVLAKSAPLKEVAEAVLEKTGYRAFIRESDEKDFRTRLEIVDEFLTACADADKKKVGGVLEFLQEMSLFSDSDDLRPGAPAITLMTCHSAKGLEFNAVYLAGLEEGLFPHASAQASREIEEERRLCYVAMTRARKRLTLTAAASRMMYGESEERPVSRFVREIPPSDIQLIARDLDVLDDESEYSERSGRTGRFDRSKNSNRFERAPRTSRVDRAVASATHVALSASTARSSSQSAQPAASGSLTLKLGTKVRHATFGDGYVMHASGSGDALRARIRFKTGRVSTFLVSKAPLEIIEETKR
jgi:DNA helicase-2/ATP-dependent DNA helicase PcrA